MSEPQGSPFTGPGQQPVPPSPQGPPFAAPGQQPAAKKSFFARHKILTTIGALIIFGTVARIGDGGNSTAQDASPVTVTVTATAPPTAEGATPKAQDATTATATAPPAAEGATPKAQPTPESKPVPGIGTAVRDGKFEFTVTSVEPGVAHIGTGMFDKDAQGQFVLVHVTVANIGDEAQHFDGSSQKLFDAQGREFSADTGAALYLEDSNSLYTEINPGNTVEGTLAFDVPVDAVPTSIELHDSMFSGGTTVSLG